MNPNKLIYLLALAVLSYETESAIFQQCMETEFNMTSVHKTTPSYSTVQCGGSCEEDIQCNAAAFDSKNLQCSLSSESHVGRPCESVIHSEDAFYVLRRESESKKCLNGGIWNDTQKACADCQFLTFGKHCEEYVTDCTDAYNRFPEKQSPKACIGLVRPVPSMKSFLVECVLYWGGVTYVATRRHNGSPVENFNRSWADFKNGFGNFDKEFFIGLENLHHLTRQRTYNRLVYIVTKAGLNGIAAYIDANVESEANNFTLNYQSYENKSVMEDGFGFGQPNALINHSPFCTYDHDCGGCSQSTQSGWWFNVACSAINLHAPRGGSKYLGWPVNKIEVDIVFYDFQLV